MSAATMNVPAANPFVIQGTAKGEGGKYDLCPSGNHAAVVVGIMDVGTFEKEYEDDNKAKYYKDVRKLLMFWELTGTRKPDGTNFVLGRRFDYTAKMTPKWAFRIFLETWRGSALGDKEELDVSKFLGQECMVNVVHTKSADGQKTYHDLKTCSPTFPGMVVPPRTRDLVLYHVSMGQPPKLDWLPYIYGQAPEDMVAECKEMTGEGPAVKNRTTPYSEPVGARPLPAHVPLSDDDIPY